jgi:hypothetical protein
MIGDKNMFLPTLFSNWLSHNGFAPGLQTIGYSALMVLLGLLEIFVYFLILVAIWKLLKRYFPSGTRWFFGKVSDGFGNYNDRQNMRSDMRKVWRARNAQRKSRGL